MTSEDAIFIYLDQNQWVYLSQAYHNHPEGKQFKLALDKLIELVNKGKVRLPLSFYHFAETQKNQNKDQRDRLAEFMAVFSQGWGIAMLDSIAPVEIQIAGAKLLGYSPPNKPKVFARDISLILNLDIELIAKTVTRKNDFSLEELETFYPFFKEFLLSPQMLKQLIAGGLYDKAMYDKSVQGYKFGIEQYAKLSKAVRAITNEFAGSQAQLKRKVISDYLTGTEDYASIFL